MNHDVLEQVGLLVPKIEAPSEVQIARQRAKLPMPVVPHSLEAVKSTSPSHRRRTLTAVAASVAVAGLVAGGVTAFHRDAPQVAIGHSVAAKGAPVAIVKARLLAALDTNSSDILKDISSYSGSSIEPCPTTTFSQPFVPVAGQEFRSLSSGPDQGVGSTAPSCPGSTQTLKIDISSASIHPYSSFSGPVTGISDQTSVFGPGEISGYDDATKTWWDSNERPSPSGGSTTLEAFATVSPDVLRQQITTGTAKVDGTATVGGVSTIELTIGQVREGTSITLWVDATTYLPVKEDFHSYYGSPTNGFWGDDIDTFTFLPPTTQNLSATFGITMPPGYSKAPSQPDAGDLARS